MSNERHEIYKAYMFLLDHGLRTNSEIEEMIVQVVNLTIGSRYVYAKFIYEDGSTKNSRVYEDIDDLEMDIWSGYMIDYFDGSTSVEEIPVKIELRSV